MFNMILNFSVFFFNSKKFLTFSNNEMFLKPDIVYTAFNFQLKQL